MSKENSNNKFKKYCSDELRKVGHYFNDEGRIRQTENDEPFQYVDTPQYEVVAQAMDKDTLSMMLKDYSFKEISVNEVPVYASPGAFNADCLVVFLPGSGNVHPPIWARSVVVNESLDEGSMFPYFDAFLSVNNLRIGLLCLNCNSAISEASKDGAMEHVLDSWKQLVAPSSVKQIAIIAHSYGGCCTDALLCSDDFSDDRLCRIAFTDSVHSSTGGMFGRRRPKRWQEFFSSGKVINWVTSDEPLDTPLQQNSSNDCKRVSAGHTKHANTSGSARSSVIEFVLEGFLEKKE